MRTHTSDAGFSLMELMAATALGLVVIGTAMTSFKDAIGMTNVATNLADASQNLRGGTNFLIHDLTLAGRGLPNGGISIPTGAGSGPILRPSPSGMAYNFDNTSATTLTVITTGSNLGPTVDNQATDMVTLLTIDPILDACLGGPLVVNPPVQPNGAATNPALPIITANGSAFTVGPNVQCAGAVGGGWLVGSGSQGQAPVKKGDLLMFTDPFGKNTIQTVTRTDTTNVYFDSNSADDTFGFNQPQAAAGGITQILKSPPVIGVAQALSVQRVLMYTYYVDPGNGTPRLMRQYNMSTPQALAGVVEDLQLTYDVVDQQVNPTGLVDLPYTLNGATYSANQIRKVGVHVGVRSEAMSMRVHDYLRSHISTVVSIRNLAFVDRYK